jgi:16S rRNA (adenine(1408)-N(1))-methyltransferase
MESGVTVVRGRRIERLSAGALEDLIENYPTVVVDIGTGDGRWMYRVARSRPDVFCIGIDANADRLRKVSFRAARKPARGGLVNIRFVLAAAEAIPAVLTEIADEVWVIYPWGSLLRGITGSEPALLFGMARILKPGGLFRAAVNDSVLEEGQRPTGLPGDGGPVLARDLVQRAGYNEAGLRVTGVWTGDTQVRSSWGGRLGQGRPVRTLWIEAVRDGNGRDHGGGRDRPGVAGPGPAGSPAPGDRDAIGIPSL